METNPEHDSKTGNNGAGTSKTNLTAPPGITVKSHAPLLAPAASPDNQASPWARARLVLHRAALLLAAATLLAQLTFLNHPAEYGNGNGWWVGRRMGSDVTARAPGAIAATSALAMALAAARLAWPAGQPAPTTGSAAAGAPVVPYPPLPAAMAEVVLVAGMLVLWIESTVAAAGTASDLKWAAEWWRGCSAIVLVLVCSSVVAWAGILACSVRALVRVLVQGCGCSKLTYGPLLDAEEESAGSPTGSEDSTLPFAMLAGGNEQPPPPSLQPARLYLHGSAALLATGVVVAQGVLMGHFAQHACYYWTGDAVTRAPALVISTAVVTAALAACLLTLHWLPSTRRLWAAAVARVPSLLAGGATAELLMSCSLLGLWAASLLMLAKTAEMIQGSGCSPVWVATNGAVRVLAFFSVLVWAATMVVAAYSFVREAQAWWARHVEIAEAAGTCMSREARLVLLVAACLLAVGTLAAQGAFMNHRDDAEGMQGKDAAVAPAVVIATAAVALGAACAILLSQHCAAKGLDACNLPHMGKAAVKPHHAWAIEAVLAACVLCLWAASIDASAKTAGILNWEYDVDKWAQCNAAVLALECASVLVWAAVLMLAVPVAWAVQALSARWPASGGMYQQLDNTEPRADAAKLSTEQARPGLVFAKDIATSTTTATIATATATAAGPASTWGIPLAALQMARLVVYLVGVLLGIGVLVAQIFLMQHRANLCDDWGSYYHPDNSMPWCSAKGSHIATAPVLVIVTAAVTICVAGIKLLAVALKAQWLGLSTLGPASACGGMAAPLAARVEGEAVVAIFALWVLSAGASSKTAIRLTRDPYNQSRPWAHSSVAVLAMACISVLVWGGAVALLVTGLVQVVRQARQQRQQRAAVADGRGPTGSR